MTSECKHRTFIVKAHITYCRKCKARLPLYRHEQARDIITRGKLIHHEEPAPPPPEPEPSKCSHYLTLEGKRVVCFICHEDLGMERQRMDAEILMERAIDDVLMREASKRIKEIVDAATASREEAWQVASASFTGNPVCPHFWDNTGIMTWECQWCSERRTSVGIPAN